ncbi:MAG: hypothetical protein ACKVXR_11035 [Planctomycetota bacterium]
MLKLAAVVLALTLPSFGGLPRIAVDDPPPEPVDCPLCGGNPGLHVARTFAVLDAGAVLVARAARW